VQAGYARWCLMKTWRPAWVSRQSESTRQRRQCTDTEHDSAMEWGSFWHRPVELLRFSRSVPNDGIRLHTSSGKHAMMCMQLRCAARTPVSAGRRCSLAGAPPRSDPENICCSPEVKTSDDLPYSVLRPMVVSVKIFELAGKNFSEQLN
jgi:hypothetical protein